ncbi:MAG: MFS transporter [Pseudomonadota bacterium]
MLSDLSLAQFIRAARSQNRRAPSSFALLKGRDFRHVWMAGGLFGTIRWLEMLSVGVYTFDRTQSPLLVSAMMVARMAPMILFGSVFGAYAERFDRKRILCVGLGLLLVLALVMVLVGRTGEYSLWILAIAMFASGTFFATDFPVRRTILAELAGTSRVGNAMAIDSTTNNATRMMGPALGGIVYQLVGLYGTYLLAAVIYLACLLLVLPIGYRSGSATRAVTGVFRTVAEGFQYIRGEPRLVATLMVTLIVNLWGFPFATMVPVIGRDEMALSATFVGLLAAAEGAGAFIGAIFVAAFARARFYMRLYVAGAFIFITAVLLFSFAPNFAVGWSIAIAGGFGVAGFATMQSTLTYTSADPAYRSRAMGALAVAIGGGPIGVFHVGLLAEWLGASTAVAVMAVEGLIALAVATWYWRDLRKPG